MIASAEPRLGPPHDGLTKVSAFFMRDWRLSTSYSTAFWLSWIAVLVDVAVAYFIGSLVKPSKNFGSAGHVGTYFSYLVVNTTFLRFQSVAVQTFSLAIRDGQTMGTLEVLLSTPTNLALIVLASGYYAIVYQLVQTLAYIGFAILFGLSVNGTNVLTLCVFLFLTILAITPIGVMASAATMVFKKTGPIEFLLTSVTTLFGGIYLPVRLLPGPLQMIGQLLPITHALNGIRASLQGASLFQMRGDLIWLMVMTALLLPLSLLIFSYAVKRAKVDGTLGQY